MKRTIYISLFIVIIYSLLSSNYAQNGEPNNRRAGILDETPIQTIFTNYGVIAQPASEGPRFSWIYPQNFYCGDLSILLGLELPIKDYRRDNLPPDGIPDTIPSVIITAVDRPGGGDGAGGVSYTFEPLPGYYNPNYYGDNYGVAISNDSQSWPDIWPDHPEYGNGVWNGLFGPDNFVGDQEALFVIDDFNDIENQLLNDFYPDSTNFSITGHGIEIKVRYVVLNNDNYKDVLFRIYDIKNKSLHNYDKVVFGGLTGNYIGGGVPEYADDVALYYPKDNLIVNSDFDNHIDESANPDWEGEVGKFGESFIYAPSTNKIASYYNFVPAGSIVMSDDYDMWERLRPGVYQWPSSVLYNDSIPYAIRGEDSDYSWGSEYFSINSGETKRIVTAAAFGYSKNEILKKIRYAEALYNSDFDTNIVNNSITITNPFMHKTISGTEAITWDAVNLLGTVEIWYSPDGGENWETIIKSATNNGAYHWNTTEFEDGAFAKLLMFLKNEDGFIYAINESGYFTVNNPGNGTPFVKILNDELHSGVTIIDEEYDFNLLVADPDNDALLVKVFYNTNLDTIYNFSQSFNVVGDTAIQTIPINLKIIPNSHNLRLKFEVTDGNLAHTDITNEFNKETPRIILSNQNFEWIRNYAESLVEIRIIDSMLIRNEEYIISFDDAVPNTPKKFTVYNTGTNQYVLQDEPIYPGTESSIFDGMILYTEDFLTQLNNTTSRWSELHPQNLQYIIDQYVSIHLSAFRYPFDYKLVFNDVYTDSSNYLVNIFGQGAPPINPNLNFKIYRNIDGNSERIQFAFAEPRYFRKDTLSFDDVLIFSDPTGNDFSWRVTFHGDSSSIVPGSGDTLFLYTKKGLSIYDSIRVYDLTVDINDEYFVLADYSLSQNYPNPFNPSTKISYNLASFGRVSLKIYDILGREVATLVNEEKPAGKYHVNFNASNLSSGVYFYRLQAGSFVQTKKMILLK